jgi:hypothetical protein
MDWPLAACIIAAIVMGGINVWVAQWLGSQRPDEGIRR